MFTVSACSGSGFIPIDCHHEKDPQFKTLRLFSRANHHDRSIEFNRSYLQYEFSILVSVEGLPHNLRFGPLI